MERKFKVGAKVMDNPTGLTSEIVYVDENSSLPYLIVYKRDTTCGSTWRSADHLELIEPKYKEGDKVWRKDTKSIWEFICYQDNDQVSIKKSNTLIFLTTDESDIEPYTGQDKPKEETLSPENIQELVNIMRNQPLRIIPLHPYTVILKSGVKVGVDETERNQLIKERDNSLFKAASREWYESSPLNLGGKFDFTNGGIAAIVPTENIVK